jgi:argininosuccinate synthase
MTRDEEIKFAETNGVRIPVNLSNPYSIDENLWGRSIECGVLDLPDQEPPGEVFEWTVPPEKAPEKPEYVAIAFEKGVPRAINDDHLEPAELIQNLNEIAGKHGVGRIDHMEDRLVGIKSREVYECPAATVLLEAHHDLEKMVLTKHEIQFKQMVDAQWAFIVYAGLWTDPLKEDLEAFINETQIRVSGNVKLKLYKGGFQIVGRSSPMSLYDHDLATYNIGTSFDQAWSHGFIEIWGLQTKTANLFKRKTKKS